MKRMKAETLKPTAEFFEMVAQAVETVGDHSAWRNAIIKASGLSLSPSIEVTKTEEKTLEIKSYSGETYSVSSKDCTCRAAQSGRPCWHRALSRLYEKLGVWEEIDDE